MLTENIHICGYLTAILQNNLFQHFYEWNYIVGESTVNACLSWWLFNTVSKFFSRGQVQYPWPSCMISHILASKIVHFFAVYCTQIACYIYTDNSIGLDNCKLKKNISQNCFTKIKNMGNPILNKFDLRFSPKTHQTISAKLALACVLNFKCSSELWIVSKTNSKPISVMRHY